MLGPTIASDIRVQTKLHIYKYSCFNLLLRNEARHSFAATDSVLRMLYLEYNIGAKTCIRSRQGYRHLSFFYFSTIVRAFTDAWHRKEPISKLKIRMSKRA